jgi:hypothetical protein
MKIPPSYLPPQQLSAEEVEKRKTKKQQSVDIAYTINHALACTTTDFIDPYFGNLTQQYLGKRFSIGCGHDHSKDGAHGAGTCNHEHHGHSHGKHWWVGEVVGDFGAVPVTIGMQRYFPNFMNGLRKIMEPALGGYFRMGAERSTKRWAAKNHVEVNSEEYKQHYQDVYQHEVSHLPQALIWTASSIAINLTTQRLMGNNAPLWHLATGKAVGASISAGLVVGGRGMAPGLAEKWDNFTSDHIFLPATKVVGRVFGVSADDVENMAKKEATLANKTWAERSNNKADNAIFR